MSFNAIRSIVALSIPRLAQRVTTLSRPTKFAILLAIDTMIVPVTFIITLLIWGHRFSPAPDNVVKVMLVMAVAGGLSSLLFGLYRVKLNTFEQTGILRTGAYGITTGVAGVFASTMVFEAPLEMSFFLSMTSSLVVLSVANRLVMRRILIAIYSRGRSRSRVLIYGAGQTGVQLASALGTDDALEPIAFIDDNPTLQKIFVAGLPVMSPLRIEDIIKDLRIERIVLAMPSSSRTSQLRLSRQLQSTGCVVSTLPSFASLVVQGPLKDSIETLDPSEYLGRDGVDKDLLGENDIYRGNSVMVTGAGGSIGSELVRQLLRSQPEKLVLFEVSEHALYQIERELDELRSIAPRCEITPVLGSILDDALVHRVLKKHDVKIILHAAAYKHVTMVEQNRIVGLRNNVLGTRILARAAMEFGVENFIFVSTDKAVHPANTMGASKRMAELLLQDVSTRSKNCRFGIVRFGNVLGSSGSVVPLFEEQILRGGPVTLSHNDVTRYFMTIGEAARLVLTVGSQAAEHDVQGGVFLLDMGAPVQISRLARQMIERKGYSVRDRDNPDGDIEIKITGLRRGEKLHEELAMRGHRSRPTQHPKIMQIQEDGLSEIEMAGALRALTDALVTADEKAAVEVLRQYVAAPDAIGPFGTGQITTI